MTVLLLAVLVVPAAALSRHRANHTAYRQDTLGTNSLLCRSNSAGAQALLTPNAVGEACRFLPVILDESYAPVVRCLTQISSRIVTLLHEQAQSRLAQRVWACQIHHLC